MKRVCLMICLVLFAGGNAFGATQVVVVFTADTSGHVLPCG